jgi:hypothetical protein
MELQERWKFSEGARLLGGCAVTFFVTALMLVLVPAGIRDFGGAWVFWAIWGSLFLLFAVMTVSLIRRFIRGGWFWRERTWREAFLGLGGAFCVGGCVDPDDRRLSWPVALGACAEDEWALPPRARPSVDGDQRVHALEGCQETGCLGRGNSKRRACPETVRFRTGPCGRCGGIRRRISPRRGRRARPSGRCP